MGSGVKDDKIYLFIFIKIYKIYTFLLVKILWNLFYALISVFLFQQFDNQMAHAIFPTVLSPVAPPKTVAADSGECSQAAFICNALLIVRLELILRFQVCSISCTCTHTYENSLLAQISHIYLNIQCYTWSARPWLWSVEGKREAYWRHPKLMIYYQHTILLRTFKLLFPVLLHMATKNVQ